MGVSRFTVYTRAYALVGEGCITEDGGRSGGVHYSITDAGREALREYRRELGIERDVIDSMLAAARAM